MFDFRVFNSNLLFCQVALYILNSHEYSRNQTAAMDRILTMLTNTKFNLYGVLNHHGTLTGGHYTAYAKHDDDWYLFDDSRIEKVTESKIITKAAYLLFYERQE